MIEMMALQALQPVAQQVNSTAADALMKKDNRFRELAVNGGPLAGLGMALGAADNIFDFTGDRARASHQAELQRNRMGYAKNINKQVKQYSAMADFPLLTAETGMRVNKSVKVTAHDNEFMLDKNNQPIASLTNKTYLLPEGYTITDKARSSKWKKALENQDTLAIETLKATLPTATDKLKQYYAANGLTNDPADSRTGFSSKEEAEKAYHDLFDSTGELGKEYRHSYHLLDYLNRDYGKDWWKDYRIKNKFLEAKAVADNGGSLSEVKKAYHGLFVPGTKAKGSEVSFSLMKGKDGFYSKGGKDHLGLYDSKGSYNPLEAPTTSKEQLIESKVVDMTTPVAKPKIVNTVDQTTTIYKPEVSPANKQEGVKIDDVNGQPIDGTDYYARQRALQELEKGTDIETVKIMYPKASEALDNSPLTHTNGMKYRWDNAQSAIEETATVGDISNTYTGGNTARYKPAYDLFNRNLDTSFIDPASFNFTPFISNKENPNNGMEIGLDGGISTSGNPNGYPIGTPVNTGGNKGAIPSSRMGTGNGFDYSSMALLAGNVASLIPAISNLATKDPDPVNRYRYNYIQDRYTDLSGADRGALASNTRAILNATRGTKTPQFNNLLAQNAQALGAIRAAEYEKQARVRDTNMQRFAAAQAANINMNMTADDLDAQNQAMARNIRRAGLSQASGVVRQYNLDMQQKKYNDMLTGMYTKLYGQG